MASARIGVLLGDLGKVNVGALKYLIVHVNTLQRTFQFEILPTIRHDQMISKLRFQRSVKRDIIMDELGEFRTRTQQYLSEENVKHNLVQKTNPDRFILLTMAIFDNKYYSARTSDISVLALGEWDRHMAPPSLLEAMVSLTLRQAVALVYPPLSSGMHLGTKGCLFDFTIPLSEVRYHTLHGFICEQCRLALDCDEALIKEISFSSDISKWVGKIEDPSSPASVVSKLGYNLFFTKGVSPGYWESFKSVLRDDGFKEIIKIIFALLLAGILYKLGWGAR